MPKRKDRVAPPPEKGGWDIRFANNQAAREWDELCNAASANARRAWNEITSDPRRRSPRQARLKKGLGAKQMEAKTLEQWQHEVTAGGRIWYCPDDEAKTVWVTAVHIGHPKATE